MTSGPSADIGHGNAGGASQVCPLCGGLGYVRMDLPVGDPGFGRLAPCACQEEERAAVRLARLRALSQLSGLERMTFDTFRPEVPGMVPDQQANLRWAADEARAFSREPNGWLLLRGGYGCGKTHLAAAIANECIGRGQPVLFRTAPDLLDFLRSTYGPSSENSYDVTFEQVRNAPVLIVDDLGTESGTPWAQEKLFQILNHRYGARLPTVLTTNHELDEIPLRLRSRLADPDLARIVSITAPDYRRAGVAQNQSDLSSLSLHSRQTFDTFDSRKGEVGVEEYESLRDAFDSARTYAERPEGWIVLRGTNYGCGKTHLAAAIANHVMLQGRPVLFILVPDLLDHLRAAFSPRSGTSFDRRFEEVRRAPLLVLDDLGTESATPWAREKLYQVFDFRYNALLPTVITTGTSLDRLDPRLKSRMDDPTRCWQIEIRARPYHSPDGPERDLRLPTSARRR